MVQQEFSTSNKDNQQNHSRTSKENNIFNKIYRVSFQIGKILGSIVKTIIVLFMGFIKEVSKQTPEKKKHHKSNKRRSNAQPVKVGDDPFQNFFDM